MHSLPVDKLAPWGVQRVPLARRFRGDLRGGNLLIRRHLDAAIH